MELTEQQKKFIDNYLETYNPEVSAKRAGIKGIDAMAVAVDWLTNDEIKKAINEREEQLNSLYADQKMTKEKFLRSMWYQYNKADSCNKSKEAIDILERIAKWNGIEPDKVSITPPTINITGVDMDKI